MKEMYAGGPSSITILFDYVFAANYTAEIFLLISGLNYFEDDSGRGGCETHHEATLKLKRFCLGQVGIYQTLMNSTRTLCQISWNVAFALELIFAW